jgi:hypothetical protein
VPLAQFDERFLEDLAPAVWTRPDIPECSPSHMDPRGDPIESMIKGNFGAFHKTGTILAAIV